jgi:hypothetical protein
MLISKIGLRIMTETDQLELIGKIVTHIVALTAGVRIQKSQYFAKLLCFLELFSSSF